MSQLDIFSPSNITHEIYEYETGVTTALANNMVLTIESDKTLHDLSKEVVQKKVCSGDIDKQGIDLLVKGAMIIINKSCDEEDRQKVTDEDKSEIERYFTEVCIKFLDEDEIRYMKNPFLAEFSMLMAYNNVIELPEAKLKHYSEIRDALKKAGGKYNSGKFIFDENTEARLIKSRILSGEDVNDKKKYQFFATPSEVADRVVELANCNSFEVENVLEPSAGKGALVDSLRRINSDCVVDLVEIMPENVKSLSKKGYDVHECDFMDFKPNKPYQRIIANPPFTNGQDIQHLRKMYSILELGGTVSCITSVGWLTNGGEEV